MRNFPLFTGVLLLSFLFIASSCTPLATVMRTGTPAAQAPVTAANVPVQSPPSASGSPLAGPISGGTGWVRVFSDEFGTGRLDGSKWTHCYWWEDGGCTNLGNQNHQWYSAANIAGRNGALELTAREQSVRGIDDRIFDYTSGIITTGRYYEERPGPDRFSFTYGYVEVRAHIPAGQGLWPAIWLLPSTHRSLPEIDIMEVLGHRPNVVEMHLHYQDGSGERRSVNRSRTVSDLSQGYHVYGLEWSPDAIVWYLDGVELWRFTDASVIPREPMYLLVNLAVGGTWPGAPDETTRFPAQFLIDYVRIWQRGQ